MTKHLEQAREALADAGAQFKADAEKLHYSVHGRKLAEFAKKQDAALSALSAHEEEVRELVALSEHALAALRAHGYDIAADHLAEQIAKVKGEKK